MTKITHVFQRVGEISLLDLGENYSKPESLNLKAYYSSKSKP